MASRPSLSVGVLAVADAGDFNEVALVAEKNAVILSAEPVERRVDVLQSLDVAFIGLQKARQGS
jgi:hypothetical protein